MGVNLEIRTRYTTAYQEFSVLEDGIENAQDRQPLKPLSSTQGANRAIPVSIVRQKQSIPYITGDQITMTSLHSSLAYWISRFYTEPGHHDIETNRLVVSMIGILASFIDRRTLEVGWPKIKTALGTCGIDIEFVPMSEDDFMAIAVDDKRFQDLANTFGDGDFLYYLSKTKVMSVLAFVLILTVTKNLNDKNYTPWCEKRVLTFSGAIGAKDVPDYLQSGMFPPMENINRCQGVFSSSRALFSSFFQEIHSIALGSEGFIQAGMREVVVMMRGHGLQHLFIIQKYLINMHPEFLNINGLQDLPTKYQRAMETLDRLDPDRDYFVKILHDKDECSALNRNNFHTASIVATAIARWEDSSFENFYIDSSPSAMKLQSLVHFILDKRRFLTPIRVGELEEGRCGPKEIAQYDEMMRKYCENDSSDPVTTNMVPSLPFQVSVPFPSKP